MAASKRASAGGLSGFLLLLALGVLLCATATRGADVPCTIDNDLTFSIGESPYSLSCQAQVVNGATLTIEPGVVIKAAMNDPPAALIVDRGAKIVAEGSEQMPITFTADSDHPDPGLWGGLILLGYAPIGSGDEREFPGLPGFMYGGSDEADVSGSLRYMRVWYAGAEVNGGTMNLNGITLAGVGHGTKMEYVEAAFSDDDGIQVLGGTVNLKHISSVFNGDNGIMITDGYQGGLQFVLSIVGQEGHRAMDLRGACHEDPKTFAAMYNVLAVSGSSAPVRMTHMAGTFGNMIVTGVPSGVEALHLRSCCEQIEVTQEHPTEKMPNFLYFSPNNLFSPGEEPLIRAQRSCEGYIVDALTGDDGTHLGGPVAAGTAIDPTAAEGGPAFEMVDSVPPDSFFEHVDYKGAFGTDNWLEGWSFLSPNYVLSS